VVVTLAVWWLMRLRHPTQWQNERSENDLVVYLVVASGTLPEQLRGETHMAKQICNRQALIRIGLVTIELQRHSYLVARYCSV